MRTVHEVSKIANVSVRTLHHYDAIGLLHPTAVSEAGYRLYDEEALERLQEILLFRELEFSLKDIKTILDHPGYDRKKALEQQITLLCMKKDRLEQLIGLARKRLMTGGSMMDFTVFNKSEMERYAQKAKAAYGNTPEYREYESRSAGTSPEGQETMQTEMMELFREFGAMRTLRPENTEVQKQVAKLQAFITAHFYTCTNEMLAHLGRMYAAGGAMTENINASVGAGTAEFVRQAIEIYCGKERQNLPKKVCRNP